MAITQQSRMAKVSSPLGDNALVMERLAGSESLGRLFHYEPVSYTHLTLPTTPYV